MKSLVYLVAHLAKNRILMVKKKPSLFILYLFFAAVIGFSVWGSLQGGTGLAAQPTDIAWLKLFFLGYMAMFAFTSVYSGLATGASVFEMSDVNFLFVSPVNPKQILVYGLMRQAVKSIFASVFILMMGGTFKTFWGLNFGHLLVVYVGYVIGLVVFQLISVVLYMYIGTKQKYKVMVVAVCVLLLLPLAASVLLPMLGGAGLGDAVVTAMHGNILYSLPVVGWITQAVFAALAGNFASALLAFGLTLGAAGLCLLLLTWGKSDYYEDVLVATETAFQRRQAALAGDMQSTQQTTRKVRVRSTEKGEVWGNGPSAFLGKHLLEDFRKNRLKLLDASSFTFILTPVIMTAFMGELGSAAIISVLATSMMLRTFLVGTGLGLKELYMHYIFMVPASSFAKIVWSNLELVVKSLVESIIAFVISGIILGIDPLTIVMCILVTTVLTLLLVAINLLSMRVFANVVSQGLMFTLYMFFVLLVLAPGIVGAVMVPVLGWGGAPLALAVLTVWELLLSALFFFLARGVLHNCDMEAAPRQTK